MSEILQAIRGMSDVRPEESYRWRFLEQTFMACVMSYGYREIRTPILEQTTLFKRSIGEITDVVEKEMYTFTDRNGDSLSLRPEGTAGCVRACIEHGLLHNQQQKLWYIGPMFRHEKPQKGRYRQFHQFGVEVFGVEGVGIELELIALSRRLWRDLGVDSYLTLEVNTLGTIEERQAYREHLISYFKQHQAHLDDDSLRRLEKNPMRILDSKNEALKPIIEKAPQLLDVLSDQSRDYFDQLCRGLVELGINFTVNPCLVRGLDYYEHTVFEWTTTHLGSQSTVCAGGRFDRLVEHLGGKSTPAVGFALGEERLLLLCEEVGHVVPQAPRTDIFIICDAEHGSIAPALALAEDLRQKAPSWLIQVNTSGGSFKSQFKKADKSGARVALIIGEDEMSRGLVSVKNLRTSTQEQLPQQGLFEAICAYMGE